MDRKLSPTLSPSLRYTLSGPTASARCRAIRAIRAARSIERSRALGLQLYLPQRLRLPEELDQPDTEVEKSSEGAIPHPAHPVPPPLPFPTRSPPIPTLPFKKVTPMLFIPDSHPPRLSRALPPPDHSLPPAPLRPDLKAPLTPTLQPLNPPPPCFLCFPPSPAYHHSSHPPHPERPSAGVVVLVTRRLLLPRAPPNSSKAREDRAALPSRGAGSGAQTPRTRGGNLSRRSGRSCEGRWRGRGVSRVRRGRGAGR
jgi:hypothetical protein